MNRIWIGVILIFLFVGIASATDIAYILEDSTQVSIEITEIFDELGFTYEIVRDSEIENTDFSDFGAMLIIDDVDRMDDLPLNEINSIFFDRDVAEIVWTLSGTASSSNKRSLHAFNENNIILEGVVVNEVGDFRIYDSTFGDVIYYLNPPIDNAIITVAIKQGIYRPVVAYSIENLADGSLKNIFFGIPETEEWHRNTEIMFGNSLMLLFGDVDQDDDGFTYDNDCNDSDPSIYPGGDEIPYDGIDQDCNGSDLTDVDEDNYDAEIVGGLDCDDEDEEINPDNANLQLNCINDAPIFVSLPEVVDALETQFVVIEVYAIDPEHEIITYAINDNRFEMSGNIFLWETDYGDAGEYDFIVTANDGEVESSQSVHVSVFERNRGPISIDIPNIAWGEDLTFELILEDYFEDEDGDNLVFGVAGTSDNDNIIVSIENGIATFSSTENWFGEDWIIFSASDGEEVTPSNQITLTVLNVNDPVEFILDIDNIEFDEDTEFDGLDLSVHFIDIDSDLEFEVFGNSEIDIEFDGMNVRFIPRKDYFGTEEIYIRASDEEFSAESNIFSATVFDIGEPPEFDDISCEREIREDKSEICTITASDFEGDEIEFSIGSENNMKCSFNENILSYISDDNYFGEASCELIVSDNIHGSISEMFIVNVGAVNDSPKIIVSNPNENSVSVIEQFERLFSIDVEDIDSNVIITWMLNGNIEKEETGYSSEYLFRGRDEGSYFLEARASDGELSARQFWNILVGDIGEFTCSDVGGHILDSDEMCLADIYGVKDSDLCCSVKGVPAFKDANSCEILDNRIEIDIIEPDSGDNFEVGDTIDIDVEIKNNLDIDQDLDVEVHLYNLDEDETIDDENANVEIKSGRDKTVNFKLKIPKDFDPADEIALFVKAEDNFCNQDYVKLDIDRKDDDVIVSNFDLVSSAKCGETIVGRVKVENIGNDDQDVRIRIYSEALDISENGESFKLEEYDEDDKETKEVTIIIPENVESGTYSIEAIAVFNGLSEGMVREIDISCNDGIIEESEFDPMPLDTKISLNQERSEALEGFGENVKVRENPNVLLYSSILLLEIILVAGLGAVYLVFRKK